MREGNNVLNKIKRLFVSAFIFFALSGVATAAAGDIVILYTNDVHSHVDTNIGYAGAAALKRQLQAEGTTVFLVDSGDVLQGDVLCAVSRGEIPMKLFDMAGYDFFTLGNHEFDYGIERLGKLLDMTHTPCLNCNIVYTGTGKKPAFMSKISPYAIKDAGGKRIAFVGVTTPNTITSSSPSNFTDENGKRVYDFFANHRASDEGLAKAVQPAVNECRRQGADYVVLLTHLGDSGSLHTSRALIKNSHGIDLVLDGHDHHVIAGEICKNADSKNVVLSSTGTGFAYIGKAIISADGKISTKLISKCDKKQPEIETEILRQRKAVEALLSEQVGYADFDLPIASKSGVRLVCCHETGIGNLCADAFAYGSGAPIALVNGGGIRAGLESGKVTVKKLLNIMPFDNRVVTVKISGQDLLDALEISCRAVQGKAEKDRNAVGKNGGFFSVHGLCFCVDTRIASEAKYDETVHEWKLKGKRRVHDVWLTGDKGQKIEKIMPDKYYLVTMPDFILSGGSGYAIFRKYKAETVLPLADYEVLKEFIKSLPGKKIPVKYKDAEGRITITDYQLPNTNCGVSAGAHVE